MLVTERVPSPGAVWCAARRSSPRNCPAYCAVAMAGLGYLPDTIFTRSVIIKMRRRAPNETVEPYRRRLEVEKGERLRERLALWATTILDQVRDTYPIMPEGIADRAADVWEALLSVADAAGGEWPERARVTAVTLVTSSIRGEGSLGIQLLTDIKTVFGEREAMATKALLNELISMDESVWADIKGKPITDRGLAFRLRTYEVGSKVVRIGEGTVKGYAKEDFYDAWQRYLPRPPMEEVTKVTSVTGNGSEPNGNSHADDQISHDERVDLMMKHTDLTQEQAETEAAKGEMKPGLGTRREFRMRHATRNDQHERCSLNQQSAATLHHFRARRPIKLAAPTY